MIPAIVGPGLFAQSTDAQDTKVTLQHLMDRVVERDPDLAALRRSVLQAQLDVDRVMPWREPEIRLSYGNVGRSAIPEPYQEIRNETITQRGSSLNQQSRSGADSSTEQRFEDGNSETRQQTTTFGEREMERSSFSSTTTRNTVRDITPGSQSTLIREQVTETTTENYRDGVEAQGSARSSEGRTPGGNSTTRIDSTTQGREQFEDNGQERTQVVEERVEERIHGIDPFDGRENYGIELRVTPPNPWERKARTAQAQSGLDEAAFALQAAERAVRLDVQAQYLALQFAERELDLLRRLETWADDEVALREELLAAGQTDVGRVANRQTDAFQAHRRRLAAEAAFGRARDELATRAGLEQPASIRVDGPLAVTAFRPDELSLKELLPAAVEIQRDQGMLESIQRSLEQELAIQRSQRIPWFSVLSASYDYETRYGSKYRDQYQFMVGLEVPVFAWFRKDDRLLTQQLEWADETAAVAEDQIRLALQHKIKRIQRRAEADQLADKEYEALHDRFTEALANLPKAGLSAREQRMSLQGALLNLEQRAFELEQDRVLETLGLEQILGARLADVLGGIDPAEGPHG